MFSIIFIIIGVGLRLAAVLTRVPLLLLDLFLSLPGLNYVWGYVVWIASLFGTAGTDVLDWLRGLVSLYMLTLPFWVARRFTWYSHTQHSRTDEATGDKSWGPKFFR